MTYIEEYKEGNKFFGIYLCKSKQILKTKAGKTYYSLLLQDKTGIIDAKVWELNNGIDDFESAKSMSAVSEKLRKESMIRQNTYLRQNMTEMKCIRS